MTRSFYTGQSIRRRAGVLLVLGTITIVADAHHPAVELQSASTVATLPEPLSDMTATRIVGGDPDLVYIAGGCNHTNGNVFDSVNKLFYCPSLSKSLHIYNTSSHQVSHTVLLPRARTRHVAMGVHPYLVLYGGRDVNQTLVQPVDIYNTATGTWTTITDLADTYVVSDAAGFVANGGAYVVGGYTQNYIAQSTVLRFDVEQIVMADSLLGGDLLEELAPLLHARGDVAATVVANNGTTTAIVSGGFTHENNFSAPLAQTEQYNFVRDTWNIVSTLNKPRADFVLVQLDGVVYSIGGEKQIQDLPEYPSPGDLSLAIDDVEILDLDHLEWQDIGDLPANLFRFAAVGMDDPGKTVADGERILSFGGQTSYDMDCQCFRTSKDVVRYIIGLAAESNASMMMTAWLSTLGILVVTTAWVMEW